MIELGIAAVLEHYGADVSVPETGWRAIRCPFHADRMASGSVNLELNGFCCHACGVSGDALKLIQLQEHLDFREACEFAREVFGESIGTISHTAKKRKPKRSTWRTGLFD